jgi:lipopolysaccharide/colanic/teichoic acid biosynthesis glycosyltransferase
LTTHKPKSHNLDRLGPRLSEIAKRWFDFAVALGGLVGLSPLLAFIALAIKRDSPGPILYRGPRVGKDGVIFKILKFRTMYENQESYAGPPITARGDRRITPVGRWLRDAKLNELPQAWNVLKGEMSLVGPRPEHPDIVHLWDREAREEILSVRPGITSPASIQFHNEEHLLGDGRLMQTYARRIMPDKLRLDRIYVRTRTFWSDLDVLLWTGVVLLPRVGGAVPPEELLFWGPISRFIRRHLSWFTIDIAITLGAFALTGWLWRLPPIWRGGWAELTGLALTFSILYSLGCAIAGAHHVAWPLAGDRDILTLAPGTLIAFATALTVNFSAVDLPGFMVVLASAMAFAGFVTVRYRSRLITRASRWLIRMREGRRGGVREKALIVGTSEVGQLASWLLAHPYFANVMKPVGFVDDAYTRQGMRVNGLEVIGRIQDIPLLVKKHDIGVVIDAVDGGPGGEALAEAWDGVSARVVRMAEVLGAMFKEG